MGWVTRSPAIQQPMSARSADAREARFSCESLYISMMTCLTFSKLLEAALVGPGCKFAAVHFRSALAAEDFLAAASTALAFAGAAEETADEFSPPPKAAPPEITARSLLSLISLVT